MAEREREVTLRDKLTSLKRMMLYRPTFTIFIVGFSVFAAFLEGIGLTFLFPIIEAVRANGGATEEASGIVGMFLEAYTFLGIPFTLEYMILGVVFVMVVRYTASFGASWLGAILRMEYERDLKRRAFRRALEARIAYYDREGSDDILNAIITQTQYAGDVITSIVTLFQETLISLIYLGVAVYLSPLLTVLAAGVLGGITYLIRNVIEPGYTVGERVADANERLQANIQAGTQGIRDVKLFGMIEELYGNFREAVDLFATSQIVLSRNKEAISNFYNLTTAVVIFVLIYAALRFFSLSLGELGVFLFAMFRLAPRVSNLNTRFYSIEGDLPHLVRTHRFINELTDNCEYGDATEPVPDTIERIEFDDVSFTYQTANEQILYNISFEIQRGEFVGFVGQSGAGKSTIVSLLARMYEPDSGEIRANNIPIGEFDLDNWRERVAMVRQNPFIFNDTLRFNLTIGNREASQEEIEKVANIAKVTEFLDDLPNGYETEVGDDGVQLSGGQRQRVALARALLRDAEVLVLDEATSDLDSDLEQQIQEAVEGLEEEYTIITIAHRLSTVRNANRIYTVEDGRITEVGSHEELLETGGKYAELYALQA